METIVAQQRFMRLALRLARRGQGRTAPNPMVGAVVVSGDRVVGQGYHRQAGGPHAEVAALRAAGTRARSSTMFVTLEPCNHHGRTPPCCDALIQARLRHVVVAARDPNPITNGRGITRLRRAGIRVTCGVLEREARQLNGPFEKTMARRLPLVVAKVGQSLDGKIATSSGESRWITSPEARRIGHRLRRDADAILVGVNTILRDDPLLTVRGIRGRPGQGPIKVIVDSRLRTPLRARCVSPSSPTPTMIAIASRALPAAARRRQAFERRGVEILALAPSSRGRVPLRQLCRTLRRRGVQSLLIEGGGEVLASAFAERLVDRLVWCISPMLIGGRDAPGSIGGQGIRRLAQAVRLADVKVRRVGPDLCVEGRVIYPNTRGKKPRAASGYAFGTRVGNHPAGARWCPTRSGAGR